MNPAPVKETILLEDFEKIDLRVGTIISVLDVKKSNKLMKLNVNFGDPTCSILAGIKKEREDPIHQTLQWTRVQPKNRMRQNRTFGSAVQGAPVNRCSHRAMKEYANDFRIIK